MSSCFCSLKPANKNKKCDCSVHCICSLCGLCYLCDHKSVYSKFQNQWYWQHPNGVRTKITEPDYGQNLL